MSALTHSLAAQTVRHAEYGGPALAHAQLSQSLDAHSPIKQTPVPSQVIFSRTRSPLHDLVHEAKQGWAMAKQEAIDTARAAPGAALHTLNNVVDLASTLGKTGASFGKAGLD